MKQQGHHPFDLDAKERNGYQYTTHAGFSSRVSNYRISRSILRFLKSTDRTIIDIGCGDGTYTAEIKKHVPGAQVLGFDPAAAAIHIAKQKNPGITFRVLDLLKISPTQKQLAHVGILRGVIHHLPDQEKGIRNACRLAKRIIVVDPNGQNPIVKLLEKFSPYHRAHGEQSFTPNQLKRWFENAGAVLVHQEFIGFVPFFCPEWLARPLFISQPFWEKVPGLRDIFAGQIVQIYVVKKQ